MSKMEQERWRVREGEGQEREEREREPDSSGSPLGPSLQQSHESSNKVCFFWLHFEAGFLSLAN